MAMRLDLKVDQGVPQVSEALIQSLRSLGNVRTLDRDSPNDVAIVRLVGVPVVALAPQVGGQGRLDSAQGIGDGLPLVVGVRPSPMPWTLSSRPCPPTWGAS